MKTISQGPGFGFHIARPSAEFLMLFFLKRFPAADFIRLLEERGMAMLSKFVDKANAIEL